MREISLLANLREQGEIKEDDTYSFDYYLILERHIPEEKEARDIFMEQERRRVAVS